MNCVKCGAELRSDQKVCIVCGTRTAAGGNFAVEEKEAWKPTRQMIYAAGAVVFILLIALVARGLKVVPPEVVTDKWLTAMVQREYNKAEQYNSPEFTQKMQTGVSDTRAMSDSLYDMITANQGTYTIGAPTYAPPDSPTQAKIIVAVKAGEDSREIQVDLTKIGRKWLIANVAL